MIGIIFSFLLCGFIALAGKRGSAPTMVLSRAAFGVRGNKLPTAISWLLTVGWETVLVILATLATATVFDRLGLGGGTPTKVIALLVVAALVVGAGVLGFDVIMRLQTGITIVTAVLTIVFVFLVADQINWATVSALPAGSVEQVIGALVFLMTGFGLGWVNTAADYSRYLPRDASSRGVVGWTTIGSAVAPLVLLVFGLLLAGSSQDLSTKIAADPIGALADLLPTWFLVPFVLVAVLGLVGGAVLDIYSSGLALLSLGLRIPRWSAALVDGVMMVIGTIWVVFFADDFLGPFQGFLYTLGRAGRGVGGDHAGRHHAAAPRLRRARAVRPGGPLRRRPVDGGHPARGRHRAGLGPGHEHDLRDPQLAGLPARAGRPRRPRGRLGVRQPRRARGAGGRVRRRARPGPRTGAGAGGVRRRAPARRAVASLRAHHRHSSL